MYKYHGNSEHKKRLEQRRCRCGSPGVVYDVLTILRDGRLLDPRKRERFLSTPPVRKYKEEPYPDGSGYGRTYIYAVNANLAVHIAPDSERSLEDAVKHETLFHNADVLAAGEIWIADGIVAGINDHSASYMTVGEIESNPTFAATLLHAFDTRLIPLTSGLRNELRDLGRQPS